MTVATQRSLDVFEVAILLVIATFPGKRPIRTEQLAEKLAPTPVLDRLTNLHKLGFVRNATDGRGETMKDSLRVTAEGRDELADELGRLERRIEKERRTAPKLINAKTDPASAKTITEAHHKAHDVLLKLAKELRPKLGDAGKGDPDDDEGLEREPEKESEADGVDDGGDVELDDDPPPDDEPSERPSRRKKPEEPRELPDRQPDGKKSNQRPSKPPKKGAKGARPPRM